MQSKGKEIALVEVGPSGYLVTQHLDRISEDLVRDIHITSYSTIDKLLTFELMVKWLETLLIMDLDNEFYKAYKEKVKPGLDSAPMEYAMSKDLRRRIKFFDARNDHAQLLILQAKKMGYLGKKKLNFEFG